MFCLGALSTLLPSNPMSTVLNNPSLSALGGIIGKSIFNNSGVSATTVQFSKGTIKWWQCKINGI